MTANPNSPTAARSPADVPAPNPAQAAQRELDRLRPLLDGHGSEVRESLLLMYSLGVSQGRRDGAAYHAPVMDAARRLAAGRPNPATMGCESIDIAFGLDALADEREGRG